MNHGFDLEIVFSLNWTDPKNVWILMLDIFTITDIQHWDKYQKLKEFSKTIFKTLYLKKKYFRGLTVCEINTILINK